MKRISFTLALMLTAATCVASPLPDFPFVYAHGQAHTELAPDTAIMTFRVKGFHKDSSNAVGQVRQRSAEVIAFLGKLGFTKEDIVSYELDKSAVRERKDYEELNILGYETTRRFKLTISDLKKYEVVAKGLFKMDNVTNLDTTFDRKDRKNIEADLLAEACKDATRQAESLATGFGNRLGDVFSISTRGFGFLGMEFGLGSDYSSMDAMRSINLRDDEDALFVPSTILFENQVAAIFKLRKE
jgi:uncharacterized protein YggE